MRTASHLRARWASKPSPPATAIGAIKCARCFRLNGADVVFDAAGAIDSPRELLRRGGQLVEVGWPARDLKSAELRALFFNGVTIINSRIRTPEPGAAQSRWSRAVR